MKRYKTIVKNYLIEMTKNHYSVDEILDSVHIDKAHAWGLSKNFAYIINNNGFVHEPQYSYKTLRDIAYKLSELSIFQ